MRVVFVAVILAMVLPAAGWCWGPAAHTMITQQAIELLPPEIKPFFDANSRYVVALCTLPDDWRKTQGPDNKHFIDLDLLDKPPFAKIIGSQADAEKAFGTEKVQKAGVLPWAIEERFSKLSAAMKAKDAEMVVVQAAVLAHFVGDAHVPFHATQFYDGKTPAQKGIHARWEDFMVSRTLKPESIHPKSAESISDIRKAAFGWLIDSYGHLDAIFAAEDKARTLDPIYTYKYYDSLSADTGAVLREQVATAAEALAGAWVSAWQAAGKPELGDKPAPLYHEF